MTVTKIFVQKKQLALDGVDVMTHTLWQLILARKYGNNLQPNMLVMM
jgi:hypothetical protein